jgi:hypothetical protein
VVGWIKFGDLWPRIRGDIRFVGWAPIENRGTSADPPAFADRARAEGPAADIVVVPATSIEARAAKIEVAIIVTARKPRRS